MVRNFYGDFLLEKKAQKLKKIATATQGQNKSTPIKQVGLIQMIEFLE
jgi:hypothetical protein